jgi:hypothetical protein
MDTDKLVEHARARFEHAAAKRTLKEKYQGKLIFAYEGGMFKVGPELITFLDVCVKQNKHAETNIIILDLYDNPVSVNVIELREIAFQYYTETMKSWFEEYEELNKNR